MTDEFAPTPASAWIDPHPAVDLELPSGNRIRAKRPNLYILGRTGQVPPKVARAAKRTSKAAEPTPERIMEHLDDIELYVDWMLTRAFLEPRLTLDAKDAAALHVSALTPEDKAFVVEALGIEV